MPGYGFQGSDDPELIRRAALGDERAFTRLVDLFYPQCLRFALHLLGERADAEEAVQDAFVRVYRALPNYEERQRFEGWLYRILLNCCRSLLAKRRRDAPLASDAVLERLPAPSDPWGEEWEEEVRRALARLPVAQREAFLLHHVEGLSYEAMAAATGEGVSTLKMRVKRARDRLGALMRDTDNV